ncbi:hypothetical protein EB796_002186 [Bugula neritina]|uniref:Uncharacterized protein n=1 Tax=Bugula neritina TaxID=10212 RepID=A0A7J7KMW1_BUGNE|nr:hypothetical protein EB796_002186 [Bugula neritina]
MESISSNTALGRYLQERHIKFVFNTPQAKLAGGVCERQIRSVKAVLNALLGGKYKNRLSTTGLCVAFYEAISTVNSRPIVVNALDNHIIFVLTPNHLITSKMAETSASPRNFDDTEIYGKRSGRNRSSSLVTFGTHGEMSIWAKSQNDKGGNCHKKMLTKMS